MTALTYLRFIDVADDGRLIVETEPVAPPPPPAPDPTPTPQPKPSVVGELLGDGQSEVLKQLWAEKHPWASEAQTYADYAPLPAYGDFGQWATLTRIATANDAYAAKAYVRMMATFADVPAGGRNTTREYLSTFALHYKWLRPMLADEQAAEWRRRLFSWCDLCLGKGPVPWGTRLGDSDETGGHLYGLRLTAKILAAEEPERCAAILADPQLEAMRQAVDRFCDLAKGGEWIESPEYNDGTLQLLFIGAFSDGIDGYPKIKELAQEVVDQQCWTLTPDLKDSAEWGDDQHPESYELHAKVSLLALIAGLTGNERARSLLAALTNGKAPRLYWIDLYRCLWCFDPRKEAKPFVAPVGFKATNVGLNIERGADYLASIFAPISLGVDHESVNVPDIQLWHKGERAINHPTGYSAGASAHNTALLAGLEPRLERIQRVSAEATSYGCKVVSSIGGRYPNWIGAFKRPDAYCDDWTRTTEFHRPNRYEVTDSFAGRQPTVLDAYYAAQRTAIETRLALWQQIWHCPVKPTVIAGGYEWQTRLGQTVRVTSSARSVVIKTSDYPPGGYWVAGQLDGWQVRFVSDEPTAEIKTTVEVTK